MTFFFIGIIRGTPDKCISEGLYFDVFFIGIIGGTFRQLFLWGGGSLQKLLRFRRTSDINSIFVIYCICLSIQILAATYL